MANLIKKIFNKYTGRWASNKIIGMEKWQIVGENNTIIDCADTSLAFAYKSTFELLRAFFIFSMMNHPKTVKWGTALMKTLFRLKIPFTQTFVKHTLFAHFCGGVSLRDTQNIADKLQHFKVGIITDYSVEGARDDCGFDQVQKEVLSSIAYAAQQPNIPFCVFKITAISTTALLAKVQKNAILAASEVTAFDRVKERVKHICEFAARKGVKIFIDAEETWIQQTIDKLAYEMMAVFNKKTVIVYTTYQMYLRGAYGALVYALAQAREKDYKIGAKIVRGAYMEKERNRASKLGYADPIQPNKTACDQAYNRVLALCVENREHMALCAGTHNEESCLLLTKLMRQARVKHSDTRFFFAQLYGMGDHISFNLASSGYCVAKYLPYGPIPSVLLYLFRRAEENTSVAGQSNREYRQLRNELKRRFFSA